MGIVSGTHQEIRPLSGLDGADLRLAADHIVQLSRTGTARQVDAVVFQKLISVCARVSL